MQQIFMQFISLSEQLTRTSQCLFHIKLCCRAFLSDFLVKKIKFQSWVFVCQKYIKINGETQCDGRAQLCSGNNSVYRQNIGNHPVGGIESKLTWKPYTHFVASSQTVFLECEANFEEIKMDLKIIWRPSLFVKFCQNKFQSTTCPLFINCWPNQWNAFQLRNKILFLPPNSLSLLLNVSVTTFGSKPGEGEYFSYL